MDGSQQVGVGYAGVMLIMFVVLLRRFERVSIHERADYRGWGREPDSLGENIAVAASAALFWPLCAAVGAALLLGRALTADLHR